MTMLDLLNQSGKKVGQVELDEKVFTGPVKKALLYDVIKMQLANRRKGNHDTLTRGQVSGSTRKIYKQKGTGNARHGDIRAPIFIGGGRSHGPHPRDYSYRLTAKARLEGLRSALLLKKKENAILVIDDVHFDAFKTKAAKKVLDDLKVQKVLLVLNEKNNFVQRSFRNLKNVKVLLAAGLNVFDICNYDQLVFTRAALENVQQRLL